MTTVPNIPGWARLEQCPKTPGCAAKVLWRDSDNKLFRLDRRSGEFVPHHCQVKGPEKPSVVWLGEFFNERTQRTRFIGPERMRTSAEKPPAANCKDWKLVNTYYTETDWQRVTDK